MESNFYSYLQLGKTDIFNRLDLYDTDVFYRHPSEYSRFHRTSGIIDKELQTYTIFSSDVFITYTGKPQFFTIEYQFIKTSTSKYLKFVNESLSKFEYVLPEGSISLHYENNQIIQKEEHINGIQTSYVSRYSGGNIISEEKKVNGIIVRIKIYKIIGNIPIIDYYDSFNCLYKTKDYLETDV